MNYQPNLLARSLKSGKTNTIGLVVADISNPFFSALARIVEDEASRNNYTVIIGSSDEDTIKSRGVSEAMLNRQVDGLIIAPTENDAPFIKTLIARKVPFVLIDRRFPNINTNAVTINNFLASYSAVSHLIEKGYKQIGLISYNSGLHNISERKRGYVQAIEDHKLVVKMNQIAEIRYQHIKEDIRLELTTMLKRKNRVDALFFATNTLAVEGLHYINEMGLQVPDEIGLISFDESDAFDFFYSPVTYVKQDLKEIGVESVRLLLNSIESIESKKTIKAKSELVIRKSSLPS